MRRLALILTLLPAALAGQQLGGVVRDSATRAPLPGAVVNALDSASKPVGRAITDAGGRWSMASAPGATRLHLIRIGFRPADVPLLSPRNASLELVMGRIPPMLEALKVAARELCPGSADRGAAFQLWQQARDGLLATIVARELKPAHATTLVFESGLSPGDETVRRQRKQLKTGETTRPFLAGAPPSFFAEHGYMSEDASGRVYNAPDADVLLDESFATTHCFHLQKADAAHANQIGLAFSPIGGRDTLVDVKGTIWIDETQPQVRSLDFLYTSLEPPAAEMHAGGHIEFRTMENGVAFIERWDLRLPTMQQIPSFNAARPAMISRAGRGDGIVRRNDRSDLRLVEVVDAGGIVVDATWPDGAHWRDTPSVISGRVAEKGSNEPVGAAIIAVGGTADSTLADSTGAFEIAVIPGKYTVSASDTVLLQFVAPRSQTKRVVAPRAGVSPIHFELPALTGVVDEVCRGQKMRRGSAMLLGRLTLEGGAAPPRDAHIVAKWQADYVLAKGTGVVITDAEQDVTPDGGGRFVVCGVSRERPIHLAYLRRDAQIADTTLKVFNTNYATEVAWTVRPPRPVIASAAAIPVMDTVRATAARYATPALRAFDDRAQRGQGQYIVDAVLRAHESQSLPEVLMRYLPGLRIINAESQAIAMAARDDRSAKASVLGRPTKLQGSGAPVQGCAVAVYMDGLPLFNPDDIGGGSPPDLNQFRVARLTGVEFYAGPSGVPAPYRASACGTLLLWSKE